MGAESQSSEFGSGVKFLCTSNSTPFPALKRGCPYLGNNMFFIMFFDDIQSTIKMSRTGHNSVLGILDKE